MNKSTFITAAIAAASAAFAAPAMAEEFTCTGAVGPVSLDNIFVPDGATCILDRTRAKGSVVVGTGATLMATSVSINGNIQAEGAAAVSVLGRSMIGGSIQAVQGGSVTVQGARITADILVDEIRGAIDVRSNNLGGNLQVFQNTGGVTLVRNTLLKGNLQCKENVPAPVGSGNRAASKEDQCARL